MARVSTVKLLLTTFVMACAVVSHFTAASFLAHCQFQDSRRNSSGLHSIGCAGAPFPGSVGLDALQSAGKPKNLSVRVSRYGVRAIDDVVTPKDWMDPRGCVEECSTCDVGVRSNEANPPSSRSSGDR